MKRRRQKDTAPVDLTRRSWLRHAAYVPPAMLGVAALSEGCASPAAASTQDQALTDERHQIVDPVGPGANLPIGEIPLYTTPTLQSSMFVIVKGADNQATRIGGLDPTGIEPGTMRIVLNWSESGHDCGQVVLRHRSSLAAAAAQFVCPGDDDYYLPINGGVMVVYGGIATGGSPDDVVHQWHVVDAGGWGKRARIQSLNLYPNIGLPMLAGTYDNAFAVNGKSDYYQPGLAGGDMDLKSYTLVRIPVAKEGATLTGLAPDSGTNGDVSALGPVKILMNYGPGRLTLKHLCDGTNYGDGATMPSHQFILPRGEDLVLDCYETVMLVSTLGDPDPDSLWRVVSIGRSPSHAESFTVTGTFTHATEILTPSANPPPLPDTSTGTIHDWDPGSCGTNIRVVTHPSGSRLGGLLGQPGFPRGERRRLVVVGAGPLLLVDEDQASTESNRFELPNAQAFVVPSRGSVWITKDETDRWKVDAPNGAAEAVQLDITPATLVTGDVVDWSPVGIVGHNMGVGLVNANWIRATGSTGTRLCSLMPGTHGRRVMITNYGADFELIYGTPGPQGGAAFFGPGDSYVLARGASVWLTYDDLNQVWLVGT